MKKVVPVAITVALGVGAATLTSTLTGTCETNDGGSDAGPPPPPDAAPPSPPDAAPADAAPTPEPDETALVHVTLYPYVTGAVWASFALPLPPGRLADLEHFRVRLENGQEVPVAVSSLGGWRTIPPAEERCSGATPAFPGIRSVLIQFPVTVTAGEHVHLDVELGPAGQRLPVGVPVRSTYHTFDDAGALYTGTEGFQEPAILAAIDPSWLACTGIGMLAGPTDAVPALRSLDDAERNFFYTSIADYRTVWTVPASDWPVDPANGPNLTSADDGVWLYQRAQTFYGLYLRSGLVDALRSGHQALWHYLTLLYGQLDCAGLPSASQKWCYGFFRLKNPDPASPYKDPKYSYAEDLATYYWLTGDPAVLPYFPWISAAEKLGIANVGWTERFAAYGLQAPTVEYEVTGNPLALAAASQVVDGLVTRQSPAGCWIGNGEWGPDGFSPWMGPMLMQELVRYHAVSGDERVPSMLVKEAQCILDHGMAHTSEIGGVSRLVPFYGATVSSSPPADADGDNPWAGIEHAPNVAAGLALGALYTQEAAQAERFRAAITELLASADWAFASWTRLTVGLPKYRLSPWRKYNWWFHPAGLLAWLLARPAAP